MGVSVIGDVLREELLTRPSLRDGNPLPLAGEGFHAPYLTTPLTLV